MLKIKGSDAFNIGRKVPPNSLSFQNIYFYDN